MHYTVHNKGNQTIQIAEHIIEYASGGGKSIHLTSYNYTLVPNQTLNLSIKSSLYYTQNNSWAVPKYLKVIYTNDEYAKTTIELPPDYSWIFTYAIAFFGLVLVVVIGLILFKKYRRSFTKNNTEPNLQIAEENTVATNKSQLLSKMPHMEQAPESRPSTIFAELQNFGFELSGEFRREQSGL